MAKSYVIPTIILSICMAASCAIAEDCSSKTLDELMIQREATQKTLDALDAEIASRQNEPGERFEVRTGKIELITKK